MFLTLIYAEVAGWGEDMCWDGVLFSVLLCCRVYVCRKGMQTDDIVEIINVFCICQF